MLAVTEQAFATDTGLHRSANEDSYLVRPPVFLVADGMGGAQAGEVASSTAAEAFQGELPAGRPEAMLREHIERANEEIHRLARDDPSLSGMGTTLTAAVIAPDGEEIAIGHVGDSRAYRLREGRLERLTRDHSLVEEMRRKGQITDEQAQTHPQRSVITRALGPEPAVEPDVQTVPARDGDVFLLCSDGLTSMVGEGRIAELLLESSTLEQAVAGLIAEANDAGGRDNITVGAFRVGDSGEAGGAGEASTGGEDAGAAREQPTLVGPAADQAGLDAAALREAAGGGDPGVSYAGGAATGLEPGSRRGGERVRRGRAAAARKGSRRRTVLRRSLKGAAALVLVIAVSLGAWWGARQVWFLGTDPGGRVSLYRGLPYELPFGIELYGKRWSLPLQTSSLPERRREAVTNHELRSRDDAVSLVEDILESSPPRR